MNTSVLPQNPAVDARVKEFRTLLKRAVLLDKKETALLDSIPDILLSRILVKNFNDNLALAERILLNKYHEIDKTDRPLLDQKKKAIKNLDKASKEVRSALQEGKKILFLTDNDNDGSMAQAVFLEFHAALPRDIKDNVQRAYAQPVGSSRGLNKENIDMAFEFLGWTEDDEILVVTADIGINNKVEQLRILDAYPNVRLVVTDHHLPVPEHVVEENKKTVIFNPQYQPTEFFKKKNISGAATLAVLLKDVLEKWKEEDKEFDPKDLDRVLGNMTEIATWSNLLDYVEADVADMPLRPYTIKKALDLRSLMNVSNSMGPLVTLNWNDQDWDQLAKEVPGLNVTKIKEAVGQIKGLNLFARKMLGFLTQFGDGNDNAFSEKEFFAMLSEAMVDDTIDYESPNPNYIAQLRPHIFRIAAIDNKYMLFDEIKDQMVGLYEDLRSVEREIVKELRSVEMLDGVRDENSAIVFPKSAHLTKIFSRKLLNKIYNEENNGFFLTLDKTTSDEYSGSMRALYPMNEILPDEEALEQELGVDIEILGHAKAAGFKIKPRPGTVIDKALLEKLNKAISVRVQALKNEEKIQSLPFLSIDFASFGLVQKINTAVKAHLSNMNGLPCLLRLGASGKNNIWVTDSQTSEQISLADVVARKKYGYQAISTDFHGNAFIIPVEQLRSVVKSKFQNVVKLSYMDDGVMIAHQAVDPKLFKEVIEFRGDRSDQRDLIGYYFETYRDGKFIPLTRDDFKNSPFFKFNSYGKSEFEHFEQLIISLLDETKQDVLAVIDTEGTGLGQAPKCFNIGGTNITIKPGSGFDLSESEFDHRMYRDESGQAYLLSKNDIEALQSVTSDNQMDVDGNKNAWRLFKSNTAGGSEHEQEFFLPAKSTEAIKLTNFSFKQGRVWCNRTIEGFAFSYIVRDGDFAITPEFENLTGISQDMVQRFGSDTAEVDQELTDYYKNLKNADGEPAKIIFSAHNLPYDKGVIGANFNQFNALLDEHVLCDTAKLARQAKLAYDDTPVASFEAVAGIPSKVYFYDSPYSSYSLSTFLARTAKKKSGVYPDTTGRYLLRYNAARDEISLIDKQEINEILLDENDESLQSKKRVSAMPNNAVKYSVERLSMRAMIRNIILHDFQKPDVVDLAPEEKEFEKALVAFQKQYHFDNTLEENIRFFLQSRRQKQDSISPEMLLDIGQRFLEKNKDIQAKFHDGWIYEKVLSLYEPTANEGKISQDAINQVNYYTDLPRELIEKVLQDTIKFQKKFGLTKALVHEQHNNIRQRSTDGQGLSDTAYESVLPNQLAVMKFYNPYNQSSEQAVSEIIDTNLRGAMQQLIVKKEYQDGSAIDSFSMKQMHAFDREMKTDLVQKAQKLLAAGGWDGHKTPLKFKLAAKTLPPGTAVYGVPRRPLTPKELEDSSEKLNFILLNEQLRTAAYLSRSISNEHGERLRQMASFNDEKAKRYRDILLDRFERVDFQRREATVKKLSEMMREAFQGKEPRFTDSTVKEIQKNPELLLTAISLEATHHNIEMRLGRPSFLAPETAEKVSKFIEDLTELVQHGANAEQVASSKIKKSSRAKAKMKQEEEFDGSEVRNLLFLPDLSIRRDEPLKFILEVAGPRFFSEMLEAQHAEIENSSTIAVPSKSKGP